MKVRHFLLLVAIFSFAILAAGFSRSAAQEGEFVVVMAPKSALSKDETITLLHRYENYDLLRLPMEQWQSLSDDDQAPLERIDQRPLFPTLQASKAVAAAPAIADTSQQSRDDHQLFLVQFVGPIKDEWLAAVSDAGGRLVHYVADYGYLTWSDVAARRQLSQMAAEGRFVRGTEAYAAAYKVSGSLDRAMLAAEDGRQLIPVTVQMLRHEGQRHTEARVEALMQSSKGGWEPVLAFQNLSGLLAAADVPLVANLPDVVSLTADLPRTLNDELQTQILAGALNDEGTLPAGPGYLAWLQNAGFSEDPADYPIVDVTDDGIGNGVAIDAGGDVTFRVSGDAAMASRLPYIANCTAEPDGSGPEGHGHINVSIAGGFDARDGEPFQDSDGYQRGLGVNPFGRFGGTRVFGFGFDLTRCGFSDAELIATVYENGARINSNSWGCGGCAGTYDDGSQIYDAGVRDAQPGVPGNQPMTILFASGNDGPGQDTVGTPGNAKNVITVGASESVRPTWTDGCGIGPAEADNAREMATFSSQGPAPGGIAKPELVAPGTHIQGTASTSNFYDGFGVCDMFWPDTQTIFAASSGTSHSTPAVAGAASLAAFWLDEAHEIASASPALLKGFLVAHATYLDGFNAGGDLPADAQGFGMPDLGNAFGGTSQIVLDQSDLPVFDNSGESWTMQGSAAMPGEPVRIVLAYTDAPGMVGIDPRVNDLDLEVEIDGQIYRGNHFQGAWSAPGGAADRANVVEAVFFQVAPSAIMNIRVNALNIAGDGLPGHGDGTDQDFTLVCANCARDPNFGLSLSPSQVSICRPDGGEVTTTVSAVGGFDEPVALSLENAPTGLMTSFDVNPVTPPGESALAIGNTSAVEPGHYDLQVEGQASAIQRTTPLALNLFLEAPTVASTLAPDNLTGLGTTVQLSWSPAAESETYDVQVATDPDFEDLVVEAKGLTSPAYVVSDLEHAREYFWRVSAANACGMGPQATAQFTTAAQPGDCNPGSETVIVYQEGFEEGLGGWKDGGLENTWRASALRQNSGTQSAHADDLDIVSDQTLVSPEIALPNQFGPLTFQFNDYQEIESELAEVPGCFDGGLLEVSTDDGASWLIVESARIVAGSYDGIISSEFENPLAGRAAWCGDPADWTRRVVDLTEFRGSTVRFRFRLGTDVSIGREGWYVDDVRVKSCPTMATRTYLPVQAAD